MYELENVNASWSSLVANITQLSGDTFNREMMESYYSNLELSNVNDRNIFNHRYVEMLTNEIDRTNESNVFKSAAKLSIWIVFTSTNTSEQYDKYSLTCVEELRSLFRSTNISKEVYILSRTFIDITFRKTINYRSETAIDVQEKFIYIMSKLYRQSSIDYIQFTTDLSNSFSGYHPIIRLNSIMDIKEDLINSEYQYHLTLSDTDTIIKNIELEVSAIHDDEIKSLFM
jgi:hypothetical protein